MTTVNSEITLKTYQDLPQPTWTKTCHLDSEMAQKVNRGLTHIIKLPMIGEYAYDFKIYSNTVLLGQKGNNSSTVVTAMNTDTTPTPPSQYLYPPPPPPPPPPPVLVTPYVIYHVDCILNYIESISLCIDSPESSLSHIRNIPQIHQLETEIAPILGMNIGFFSDMPLLTGALGKSDLYLVIKFKKLPPIKYFLSFEIGCLQDLKIIQQMQEYTINVPGAITIDGFTKQCNLRYELGKLNLIS